VRLHVGRATRSRNIVDEPPDRPTRARGLARVVELHSVYRITSLAGKFGATFGGLEAPACSGADACGVSGAADWAILSGGGTFVVDASALARGSDHGLQGLLAAVRRTGGRRKLAAYADLRHEAGTISARVERSGGAACHDSESARPPYLFVSTSRTAARFVLGKADLYPHSKDLLRTGCPGPTEAGVLRHGAAASGRLALASLARRRITLPLRGGGRFDDGAYGGAWRSRFTMRLERIQQRLTYRFRRVAR
jgi:hypothetical protein